MKNCLLSFVYILMVSSVAAQKFDEWQAYVYSNQALGFENTTNLEDIFIYNKFESEYIGLTEINEHSDINSLKTHHANKFIIAYFMVHSRSDINQLQKFIDKLGELNYLLIIEDIPSKKKIKNLGSLNPKEFKPEATEEKGVQKIGEDTRTILRSNPSKPIIIKNSRERASAISDFFYLFKSVPQKMFEEELTWDLFLKKCKESSTKNGFSITNQFQLDSYPFSFEKRIGSNSKKYVPVFENETSGIDLTDSLFQLLSAKVPPSPLDSLIRKDTTNSTSATKGEETKPADSLAKPTVGSPVNEKNFEDIASYISKSCGCSNDQIPALLSNITGLKETYMDYFNSFVDRNDRDDGVVSLKLAALLEIFSSQTATIQIQNAGQDVQPKSLVNYLEEIKHITSNRGNWYTYLEFEIPDSTLQITHPIKKEGTKNEFVAVVQFTQHFLGYSNGGTIKSTYYDITEKKMNLTITFDNCTDLKLSIDGIEVTKRPVLIENPPVHLVKNKAP